MIQAVGKFTVTTSGTVVVPFVQRPDLPPAVHSVIVQALPANTGAVYVGDTALDRVNVQHCYAVLPTPTANAVASFEPPGSEWRLGRSGSGHSFS